jgi:hypothetical protein
LIDCHSLASVEGRVGNNGLLKPKEIGRALLAIWSDLTAERVWQYQELPPFLVVNLKELNFDTLGDSEHSRAKWFWSRRSKVVLYESGTALPLSVLCGLLCLNIAFARLPLTSSSELASEATILFLGLAIAVTAIVDKVRLVRWRREYELSVNRLIQSMYREMQ